MGCCATLVLVSGCLRLCCNKGAETWPAPRKSMFLQPTYPQRMLQVVASLPPSTVTQQVVAVSRSTGDATRVRKEGKQKSFCA